MDEVQKEYAKLLAEEETIEIAFKIYRDLIIFTNKRLILVNKQGLTGKRVEYLSVKYESISKFCIATAGHFDLESELKIWITSEVKPTIEKKFNKQVNMFDLQKILAQHVCQ